MADISPAETAFAAVERARREVEAMRLILSRIESSASRNEQLVNALQQKINVASTSLSQAERIVVDTKEKLRAASLVSPKPRDSIDTSSDAKRALEILSQSFHLISPSTKRAHISPPHAPLLSSHIHHLISDTFASTDSAHSDVNVSYFVPKNAFPADKNSLILRIACRPVLKALIRIQSQKYDILSSLNVQMNKNTKTQSLELVDVVVDKYTTTDEELSLFQIPKTAVFRIVNERANSALRHFWMTEIEGIEALKKLVQWIALHRTMFRDVSFDDGRRLKFDAGVCAFLPPCVRSFDPEDSKPRHPRSCVPHRSSEVAPIPQSNTTVVANNARVENSLPTSQQQPVQASSHPLRPTTQTVPQGPTGSAQNRQPYNQVQQVQMHTSTKPATAPPTQAPS